MDSDPIGEIARRLAWILVGAAVMDAADERLTGFGRRFPRTLRFARIVGGAFLVLAGLFEAVLAMVVLADVAYSEGVMASLLVLLIPLAFGVGLTVWGLGLMRRGWASPRSVSEQPVTPTDALPAGETLSAEEIALLDAALSNPYRDRKYDRTIERARDEAMARMMADRLDPETAAMIHPNVPKAADERPDL